MSDTMVTLLIFLGGVLLVALVLALDELTAFLGLQPGSRGWLIRPLSRTGKPDPDPEAGDTPFPARAGKPGRKRTGRKDLPATRLVLSPALTATPGGGT